MILSLGTLSFAQPASPPSHHVSITISPAASAVPALRYRLLPPLGQQTPGNAATQYLIAFELLPQSATPDDIDDLLGVPLKDLDTTKTRAALREYASALAQVRIAADRQQCQWDLPLRQEGINTLLPYLARVRQVARALALQSREQIADRRFDDAGQTLRTGFAMVHHLQNEGVLVQGLVEAGIADLLLARVSELQQASGSPNLYWALANLPKPLIDTQTIAQAEQAWIDFSFPELRGRPVEQLTDDELRGLFRHMKEFQSRSGQLPPGDAQNLAFAGLMAGVYGSAREYLIAHGRTEEQVRQMPVEAVLAPYVFNQAQRWSDESFKWAGLPYWQSRAGIEHAQQENTAQAQQANNPLATLLPAIDVAFLHFAQTERMIARLQLIEALRAYASTHDGQFPPTLDALSPDMPAPIDPITGKNFGYEAHGKSATLTIEGITSPKTVPQLVIEIKSS
ncbi:MAG TPA: hypothetical protein VH370_14845 [Humisphaera sp.]|jgi:hypothetical protein|nr:hypothetical protein [Humisphaera sp.]